MTTKQKPLWNKAIQKGKFPKSTHVNETTQESPITENATASTNTPKKRSKSSSSVLEQPKMRHSLEDYYNSLYNSLHITQETTTHINTMGDAIKKILKSNLSSLLANAEKDTKTLLNILEKKSVLMKKSITTELTELDPEENYDVDNDVTMKEESLVIRQLTLSIEDINEKLAKLSTTIQNIKNVSSIVEKAAKRTVKILTSDVDMASSVVDSVLGTTISTIHFFSGDVRKWDTGLDLSLHALPLNVVQWTNTIKTKRSQYMEFAKLNVPYQPTPYLDQNIKNEENFGENNEETDEFMALLTELDEI